MSDFRRWRDWHLIAMGYENAALDGRSSHPKLDVNGDGFPGPAEDENVFPYGDFNGDGTLDLTSTRFVPGYVSATATDLEVLQSLFQDPHYSASQLPNLVESVDIHTDASACFDPGRDLTSVRITILDTAENWALDGEWTVETSHEWTVPYRPGGYTVRIEGMDDWSGNAMVLAQKTFTGGPGSDFWFAPTSCGRIDMTPDYKGFMIYLNKGDSTDVTARMSSRDLAATWEFTNSVENVETSTTHGNISAGGEATIGVKATCPDRVGNYGGVLNMLFKDSAGGVISGRTVPEWLAVSIMCLEGGVTVSPDPVEIKASPGGSASGTFTLTNNGTALNYKVTAGDHLSGDAEGELAQTGTKQITVSGKCPTQQGRYSTYVTLHFEKPDGQVVTDDVPTAVRVELVCERVSTPFRFIEQLTTTEVDLARPNQHVLLRFHSIPGNETATEYVEEDHVAVENDEFEWNGFGTRFAHINNVSGSSDLCPGCGDPQTRTRSAKSNLDWEATIGAPHVTISGDFSQAYTQTRLVSGNSDRVEVSLSFDFLLLETADLAGTWSCTGTCSISLRAEDGSAIITSSATGAFDDPLEPGRYVLLVQNRLPMDGTALSVAATGDFSFQLTFVELEEE
jgi:hypothetical protein